MSLWDVKNLNVVFVFVILAQFGPIFLKIESISIPIQIETKFYLYINVTMIFLTRLSFYFSSEFYLNIVSSIYISIIYRQMLELV